MQKLAPGQRNLRHFQLCPGVTVTSGPIVFHSLGYMFNRGKDRENLPRDRKLSRFETRGNFLEPG